MNLICLPLGSSRNGHNLDRFMRNSINGHEKPNNDMLDELIQDFSKANDSPLLQFWC